ncbi:hypothetical protein GCM10011608_56330 [Micromonospora sonchi]|uniref:Uncharacterized protein n=1 Tax=Micromonospora sonchi TaxID=1763543 RepID=A0A917X2Z3_9ACTN|nr:hypothetical protein GCM10011608_56330 [Micromonospora sonchi]
MPRRKPKFLRQERWKPARGYPVRRVRGVSALTRVAVRRVEAAHYWPNAIADALERYRSLLRQPGRYLDGQSASSPGLEPEDARDLLEDVLRQLSRGARKDLERVIFPLDDDFKRRTLPALWWTDWAAGRWWYQRAREL